MATANSHLERQGAERRSRFVDAEIRGVSYHLSYRDIRDYRRDGGQVTRSSLLSVTGQYGRRPDAGPPAVVQAILLFRPRFDEEPGREEESRYRDQRVRDALQGKQLP